MWKTHAPQAGTKYNGGTMAECEHCGARIMFAAIAGTDEPAAWRTNGTATGTRCPGA